MTKRAERRGRQPHEEQLHFEEPNRKAHRPPPPFEPRTAKQKQYAQAIKSKSLIFGVGPAGTGKTYVCGTLAALAYENKQVDKIIITRPAVDAEESLGFLPGELEEKYEPYIQPLREVFIERFGPSTVEYMLKNDKIEAAPLAYMRGRTFKNAFVILDEAQNTTPTQMKLFLTRIGENCKVVVNGDPSQVDIKGPSGLEDAIRRVGFIPQVQVVTFSINDSVRSGLVAEILQAYEQEPPKGSR